MNRKEERENKRGRRKARNKRSIKDKNTDPDLDHHRLLKSDPNNDLNNDLETTKIDLVQRVLSQAPQRISPRLQTLANQNFSNSKD